MRFIKKRAPSMRLSGTVKSFDTKTNQGVIQSDAGLGENVVQQLPGRVLYAGQRVTFAVLTDGRTGVRRAVDVQEMS
jgi:cold shock CspA family protein